MSCFLTAALTVILGFFVLKENPKKKLNLTWFFASVAIFIWTTGLGMVVLSNDSITALFWQKVLYVGTVFIPILYFNFCIILVNKEGEKIKHILFLGYFLSLFFVLFSFTKLMIIGVENRTYFDYWPVKTGGLYILFLIYFVFYSSYGIILLFKNRKNEKGVVNKSVNYMYYASIVGFVGGSTNFLLDFNLNFYPFGNYFVAFYVVFITYAVVKHGLFNIKVVATEMFTIIISLLIALRLFSLENTKDVVIQSILLLGTIIFGIFLIKSVKKEIETREKGERLARYLANANARLRELDKQKTEFVSIASHQLRSPIAAIKGYTSMIVEGAYGEVPKDLELPLSRVLDSGKRIAIMVDDFLNVTRIEQGRMTYDMKRQNVYDVVKSVVGELGVVAKDKNLTLTLTNDSKKKAYVKADKGKLTQIFSNLIDNAIKYTHEGFIKVKIDVLEKEKRVLVRIKDTGIGIAPEEIQNLFKKFNRASNANEENVLGTGLGLYIAREIMKAHQGWINVESEGIGKGSTFTVELPLYDEGPKENKVAEK